jgi:hypothetical protein
MILPSSANVKYLFVYRVGGIFLRSEPRNSTILSVLYKRNREDKTKAAQGQQAVSSLVLWFCVFCAATCPPAKDSEAEHCQGDGSRFRGDRLRNTEREELRERGRGRGEVIVADENQTALTVRELRPERDAFDVIERNTKRRKIEQERFLHRHNAAGKRVEGREAADVRRAVQRELVQFDDIACAARTRCPDRERAFDGEKIVTAEVEEFY